MEHKYEYNPLHRNGNPNKSQWDVVNIGILDEEQIWNESSKRIDYICYGLYIPKDKPDYLGFPAKNSSSILKKLFIAKFRGTQNGNIISWHGYPIDTTLNTYNRPSESDLIDWQNKKYIKASLVSKILKGKKCFL